MVWQKGSLCLHPQLTANRTLNQSRLIHRDGCSLSCKDGAVVWQSSEQLAAGCLTILEMSVDDCRCPHSLIHFGAISVNFIMWSLCFTILTEFSLGFLWLQWGRVSWDRNRVFLVESWVSPGSRRIRHWSLQRPWLLLPWDQWQGSEVGSCLLSYLAGMQISGGLVKFTQGMICWIVNAVTSFQIVMHG